MPICFDGCSEVDGTAGSRFEVPYHRISKEGVDRGVEIGLRDHSSLEQVADTFRLRLSLGHYDPPTPSLQLLLTPHRGFAFSASSTRRGMTTGDEATTAS